MTAPRFLTDEDVYAVVASALRKAGLDAVSTPDVDRLGESDESQLAWAVSQGRILVTFNVAHFAALHAQWISQGQHHADIIVSIQRPIGDLLRRLFHLADTIDAESMQVHIEYLSDW